MRKYSLFLLHKWFTLLRMISSVPIAASFKLRLLCSCHNLIAIQICFFEYMNFLKDHPRKRVCCNISLSYLQNVFQRNLRTDRATKCIFRVSGGTNFEYFYTLLQPWWCLRGFNMCTGLPTKNSGCITAWNKF